MSAMRKARKIVIGAVASVLLMSAGAALAAMLLHFAGSGSITSSPGTVVVLEAVHVSDSAGLTCSVAKVGEGYTISISNPTVGGFCKYGMDLRNNGSTDAYEHPATISGAGAAFMSVAQATRLLPHGGAPDGSGITLTITGDVGEGANLAFAVDNVVDQNALP